MNKLNIKYTQNYITSKSIINQILLCTNFNEEEHIIEIGAGKGHFTRVLSKNCNEVTAVEIDKKLCSNLELSYQFNNKVQIINDNILKYDFPKNLNYKILGNIPYNISTAIIKKITYQSNADYSFLIVEWGFAKRLLNINRAFGLILSKFMEIEIFKKIPRSYFHLCPRVDSALIVLKRKEISYSQEKRKIHEDFVYKWVNKDYKKLFTKNQIIRIQQYPQISDFSKVTID